MAGKKNKGCQVEAGVPRRGKIDNQKCFLQQNKGNLKKMKRGKSSGRPSLPFREKERKLENLQITAIGLSRRTASAGLFVHLFYGQGTGVAG